MFSYFSIGSIVGNVLMGLASDLLPIRTPIFETGIVLSTIFIFLLSVF